MFTSTLSGFQLSPQQQRLWPEQKQHSAYVAQSALLLTGELQPAALQTAITQVCQRHEILRTTFHRWPGLKLPVMVVGDSPHYHWQELTREAFPPPPASLETILDAWFYPSSPQPWNLEQGPLLEIALVPLESDGLRPASGQHHLLLLRLPAVCADTWSLNNLVAEIRAAYGAAVTGTRSAPDLDEVLQYAQVAEWQHQLLDEPEAESGLAYWQQQPLAAVSNLSLPGTTPAAPGTAFTPARYPLDIAPPVLAQLQALVTAHDATVAAGCLTCWQILLWRLTNQQQMVVGMAFARRDEPELQPGLGLIATWLPLHCDLVPDLRWREALALTQQAIATAREWQDDFVPERAISSPTPFQFPVGFEFEQWPSPTTSAGVQFTVLRHLTWIEPCQVKLSLVQQGTALQAALHYDASVLTPTAIQSLAAQFQTLLASAISQPDQRISELDLLSQSDRQQILFDWNQTHQAFPSDRCLHDLFTAEAEQNPQAIAVQVGDQQLTYGELNARANQLAHWLQQQGLKPDRPDQVVGLYLERSLEFIIGLLGILKAGAAYLPLDPALPPAALSERLRAAQVDMIVTQEHRRAALSNFGGQVISLDTDGPLISQSPVTPPTTTVRPEHLAYVLFTSGTTGQPKGVAVEHRQLVNYLQGIQTRWQLPTGASYAIASTFAADLGHTMTFAALITGGCLHILSQECATNPAALADYMQRFPIDWLKLVPSHLAALLGAIEPQVILPRQGLVLGGEALPWSLVEQIRQAQPTCRLINHYGPTETTVGTLTYEISAQPPQTATVPIGRPLANTRVYVLDPQGQPVPVGVAGELFIAGAGLARGYLHQPELTAAQFIPPVHPQIPETRLYRTGDRVRYLPDGNLEFLGRLDHQVKIRGFRIEPEAIAQLLQAQPAVRAAIVVPRTEAGGEPRLVAYVIPQPGQECDPTTLRQELRQHLPEYMVPASFVCLRQFPLTANGKVDRQALPAPEAVRPDLAVTYLPPQTALEQAIAGIWQKALHLDRVGRHDNFFDLGGHSLLLVQVYSQLRQQLGAAMAVGVAQALPVGRSETIAISDLFEYPTISTLAAYLSQNPTPTTASPQGQDRAATRQQLAQQQRQLRQQRRISPTSEVPKHG